MPNYQFCPNCFRKNDAFADQCAFCQTPLSQKYSDLHTTVHVPEDVVTSSLKAPCAEYDLRLKHPGFALFIINQPEPVVIESNKPHILGRFSVETGETLQQGAIDLTDYDAVELGVSRYHAEISYTGEAFALKDLDSTNGTWLNQMRLTPGSSYVLKSDDRIVLGRLIIWVCVSQRETAPLKADFQ